MLIFLSKIFYVIPFLVVFSSITVAIFYFMSFAAIREELKSCISKLKTKGDLAEPIKISLIQISKESRLFKKQIQETIASTFRLDDQTYTIRPLSEIWHRHAILSVKFNPSLLESIPNIIIGLGLAITFFLLAIVLGDAGSALSEKGTSSIQNLLNNASSKFWISVSAILCSIVFSVFIKKIYAVLQIDIDNFISELKVQGLNHFGAEQTIMTQLKLMETIATSGVQIANQTNWYQVNFFQAISTSIDQTIRPLLVHQLQQTNEILKQVKDSVITLSDSNAESIIALGLQIKEINQNAMRRMIDDFRHSLTAASSTEVQLFQKTMKNLSDELNQACQKLVITLPAAAQTCTKTLEQYTVQWSRDLQQSALQNAEQLTLASQQINQNLQLVQSSTQQMNETLTAFSQMSAVAQNNMQMTQEMAEMTYRVISSAATKIEPIFEEIQHSLQSLSNLTQPASESMLQVFDHASTGISEFSEQLSVIAVSIHRLGERMVSLDPISDTLSRLKEEQYDFLESHLTKIDNQVLLLQQIFQQIKPNQSDKNQNLLSEHKAKMSLNKDTKNFLSNGQSS